MGNRGAKCEALACLRTAAHDEYATIFGKRTEIYVHIIGCAGRVEQWINIGQRDGVIRGEIERGATRRAKV